MIILESATGNYVTIQNKQYSYFAGNDYLGLANNPLIKQQANQAIATYGMNFSASRKTTGTSSLHQLLEKKIAQFKDSEAAIVFASGYLGNYILINALSDKFDAIFTDESVHPSMLLGFPSNKIREIHYYKHCDSANLEELLEKHKTDNPLILTDGIFALTGEIAPIAKIHEIAVRMNAILVVDDAHGTGILGETGKGTPEYFGLHKATNIYQTETFSKAFGVYGGFIASTQQVIEKIFTQSPVFAGSTALPPTLAAAAIQSLELVSSQPELRNRLFENIDYLKPQLLNLGFNLVESRTPIASLFFETREKAVNLSEFLYQNQIIAPFIEYPVKHDNYIIRLTISSAHTKNQIDNLIENLQTWKDLK